MISRHCPLCESFAIISRQGDNLLQQSEINFFEMDGEVGGMGSLTINTVFSFQKYVLNFYAVDCYRYRCAVPT